MYTLWKKIYRYSGCSSGWNEKIAFAVFSFRKLYIECYMDVSTYTKKYINFVAKRVCVFVCFFLSSCFYRVIFSIFFFSVSIYLKTIKSIQTYVKYNLHIRIHYENELKKCIFHMAKCIPDPNAKQVNIYVERKNIIHVLSSNAFHFWKIKKENVWIVTLFAQFISYFKFVNS